MKKIGLIFFLALSFCLNSYAQTYTIPWAQEQPAWVFPLWFENANGAKDTLYFCYDHNAGFPSDTLFGEKLIKENSDSFYLTFEHPLVNDSMHLKVIVLNEDFFISQGATIFLLNAQLPIILRWDRNVFYADSIPYPNQNPLPEAQGVLWYDYPMEVNNFSQSCNFGIPVLMTDTVLSPSYCHGKDSIIFTGTGVSYLAFIVDPWTGNWTGIDFNQYYNNLKISISPNPVGDQLKIFSNFNLTEYTTFRLLDISGQLIDELILNYGNTWCIETDNLQAGFYLINIQSSKLRLVIPFIKQ